MNRRHFALAGLSLVPTVSSLLATAEADARKRRPKPRPKPKPKTKTKFVTTIVTRTFSNQDEIRLRDRAPATPYPSTIAVSGFTKGVTLDVNLTLNGFTHDRPFDAAIMLVAPSGKGAIVMHNVGGSHPVTALVTLDDQAASSMPNASDTKLTTGTYKPTSFGSTSNLFPAPAPQGVTETALATFNGDDPNGAWRLFAVDDEAGLTGAILFGWSLTITAEVTVTVRLKRKRRRRRQPRLWR